MVVDVPPERQRRLFNIFISNTGRIVRRCITTVLRESYPRVSEAILSTTTHVRLFQRERLLSPPSADVLLGVILNAWRTQRPTKHGPEKNT